MARTASSFSSRRQTKSLLYLLYLLYYCFTTAYFTSLLCVCFQFARSSCTQGRLRAEIEGTRVRGCGSRVRGCSCPRLRPTVPIYLYTMLSTASKASKACVRELKGREFVDASREFVHALVRVSAQRFLYVCMYVCMYTYIHTV